MLENFKICFTAVLPLFIIMAAGYTVKRVGLLREEDVPRFNNVAFRAFMPCLLFYSIYTSDLSKSASPELIIFAVCSVFAVYFTSVAFILATEKEPEKRGVMIQGLYRSNFVIIGLPIANALVGAESTGYVALLIAILVPVYNVLAVITLEVFNGGKISIGKTLLSILKNPFIIGTALGLLAQLFDLEPPGIILTAVEDLGSVAIPLQLFLLGAFFHFSGMGVYRRNLITLLMGRLVVIPGVVLFAAAALGFRGVEFVALLGCFAAPTAISSFTMAQQMGGDAELAGNIVVLTSALCPVFIFFWTFLFKSLGIY